MRANDYDLAIVGAGSAGLIAADFARKLGARVILLERDRIGGDCTWTGCVPSKSLLRVARVAHDIRTAERFGLTSQSPSIDMAGVRRYLHATRETIYRGTTPEALARKGIDVAFGDTRFLDARTLAAGDRRIRAGKVLIATGARPAVPALPGIDRVPYVTYRDIFERSVLPQSMAVIGGGPVGVEIAQAYQRLGVRVTLFAERLLAKEEPQAAGLIRDVLEREGVTIVAARAQAVERTGDRLAVRSSRGDAECDLLFLAAGRRPMLDGLHLEAAGVSYAERGITVNDRLQTSAKHIYAAGDVVGGPQFSHYAGWQGFQAARNALLPGSASGLDAPVPRVTFTDPEIAQVGLTEAQARAVHPKGLAVACFPIEREDRAICDDDRDGMLKLITTRRGRIVGATLVAHRAGEAIAEIVLAMRNKLTEGDLAATIHAYPTYSTGVQLLASEMAVDRALSGFSGALIRAVSKLTR